jgi:hypothetical protein
MNTEKALPFAGMGSRPFFCSVALKFSCIGLIKNPLQHFGHSG